MNQIPKLSDFEAPEGYFGRLPDQILAKSKVQKSQIWVKYAAAAVVIFGMAVSWKAGVFAPKNQVLTVEEVASLYIESQVWTAEDILSMADDPNALLDQIIEEEMPLSEDLWIEDELNWF